MHFHWRKVEKIANSCYRTFKLISKIFRKDVIFLPWLHIFIMFSPFQSCYWKNALERKGEITSECLFIVFKCSDKEGTWIFFKASLLSLQCFDGLLFIFGKELKIIAISLWMPGLTRHCISGDRRGWKMWFKGSILFLSHCSLYWLTLAAWEGAAVYFQPLSILFLAIVPTILLDSTHREPEQWLSSKLPGAERGTAAGRSCFQLGWAHSAADQVLLLHSAYFELWDTCSRFEQFVHLK